tara:strand:+ start:1832 stop:2056 length:225 start_codon:yes stop_codon:yes gene_type:complete
MNTVEMPSAATILSVGEQAGDLVLWAHVDTSIDASERTIEVHPTGGRQCLDPSGYIGTVQMRSGLVWHVFEGER